MLPNLRCTPLANWSDPLTEMRNPDPNQTTHDHHPIGDLLDGADDPAVTALLEQARTAWLSTTETQPNDALRSFLADAAHPEPASSPRAGRRWSATMIDKLANLTPSPGRAAFGASLAAVIAAVAAASFGLTTLGANETGAASSSSTAQTSTSTTDTTTATTATTWTTHSTAAAHQDPITIRVADAGTATITAVDGVPVLLATEVEPGWQIIHEVPDEPHEIDLSYRRGDDRVDLDIEIDDGQIRVRIRDRRTDTDTETYLGSWPHTSTTQAYDDSPGDDGTSTTQAYDDSPGDDGTSTTHDTYDDSTDDDGTSTTHGTDDDSDYSDEPDVDNSGPGNAENPKDEHGVDNSGPGNAEDRNE